MSRYYLYIRVPRNAPDEELKASWHYQKFAIFISFPLKTFDFRHQHQIIFSATAKWNLWSWTLIQTLISANLSCCNSSNICWQIWFCFVSSCNSSYFSFATVLKESCVMMTTWWKILHNRILANLQRDFLYIAFLLSSGFQDSTLELSDKTTLKLRLLTWILQKSVDDYKTKWKF